MTFNQRRLSKAQILLLQRLKDGMSLELEFEHDGDPTYRTGSRVWQARTVAALINAGLIVGTGDGLFPGLSQTFVYANRSEERDGDLHD